MAGKSLSHLDDQGRARMVDVGSKEVTARRARAEAFLTLSPEAYEVVSSGPLAKGEPFSVARLAGIAAAKKTADLIPLCHSLPLDAVTVEVGLVPGRGVRIQAEARTHARTGVEMEAMVGAALAALAFYDMVKGIDRGAEVTGIRLLEKEGGVRGRWERET